MPFAPSIPKGSRIQFWPSPGGQQSLLQGCHAAGSPLVLGATLPGVPGHFQLAPKLQSSCLQGPFFWGRFIAKSRGVGMGKLPSFPGEDPEEQKPVAGESMV